MDCKMGLWVINGSVRGRRMDVLLNTKGAFFFLTGMVPVHMKDYVLAEKRIKEKNSFCHFSPISLRIKTSSRQFEACATLFLGRRQHLRIIVRTSLHHLSLHLVPQSWILGPRVYIFSISRYYTENLARKGHRACFSRAPDPIESKAFFCFLFVCF